MTVESESPSTGITRRTVTKAMAWAVPAIAIAAPVPAFAASGSKPNVVVGSACKAPGASVCGDQFKFGYAVPVTITNLSGMDVWITGITITSQTPDSPTFTADTSIPLPILIPADGTPVVVYFIARSSNSANIQNGSITFNAAWGHAADGSDTEHADDPIVVTTSWASTPPGCACF